MTSNLLFTGDIMAQIAQNTACRTENEYDYSAVLEHMRPLLSASDLTIGNMETPFAGEERKYSFARYSFNTPNEMAAQIKKDGFSLVSLANNHCMDRNIEGLYHTLDVLDEIGLPNTGLARSAKERERCCILEANDIRFGFLAYTYGTNAFAHHLFLPEDALYAVNLIQPQETLPGAIDLLAVEQVSERVEALYHTPNAIYEEKIAPLWKQLEGDIARLRQQGAEAVIMLLHCGGQHDPLPDAYTKEVISRLTKLDIDTIICNHQHVLHPFTMEKGIPVAWCLGNLIQTPAELELPGYGSSYSALMQIAFEKQAGKVCAKEVTVRLTRSVEDAKGRTVVYPLDELIAQASPTDRDKLIQARNHYVNFLRNQPEDAPVEEGPSYRLWSKDA